MIAFDFIYCRPDTPEQAVQTHAQLHSQGKSALYYAGGSEIITMCRAGDIRPDAVIDIKAIPQCNALYFDGQALHIGAACTLNRIKQTKLFDLLTLACGRIADHTNQCRITLGGNLCGTILYRETSLPLLLADASVTLCDLQGQRTVPFTDVFDGRMRLAQGQLLMQVHIPAWTLRQRCAHIKKTTQEKIDYPLVSVAALGDPDVPGALRVAFTGVCAAPFRSAAVEAVLNDRAASSLSRAQQAATLLSVPPLEDVRGSGAYRLFVLTNTLHTLLEEWQHAQI